MTGSKYIKHLLLLLILSSNIIFSTDYYVSSSTGNDNNSGLSESTPWRSISKINSIRFQPGDKILLKRGSLWKGTPLKIRSSGSSSSRIFFGAYGEGENPIITLKTSIPDWNTSGNWINTGNGLWKFIFPYPWKSSSHKLRRLWLNGKEYSMSAGISTSADNLDNLDGGATTYGTNEVHRFFSSVSNGTLNLYVWTDGTNPTTYYNSMEYSGLIQPDGTCEFFTINMSDADHISIDGINIQGGLYGAIGMRGCDYVIINNCNFGNYSQYVGLMCNSGFITASDPSSDYGIVKNCIIDSDFKEKYYLQYSLGVGVQFGIASMSGATNWNFHSNKINRWAIGYLDGNDPNTSNNSEYNKFYNNEVYYVEGTYAKGAQVNGSSTFPKTNTKIYNNKFHHLTSGINICGSNVEIQNNIFHDIRWAYNEHASKSNSGYGIQIVNGGFSTVLDNNIISNNIFYNLNGWVLLFAPNNVWFENNLMVNCRTQSTAKYYIQTSDATKMKLNNNLFYEANANSSTKFINLTGNSTQYSVAEINQLSETSTSETNNNIQYIGLLQTLLNVNQMMLPNGSAAINKAIHRNWMLSEDYYGNSLSGIRDIGAIEYLGSQNITINSTPKTTCIVNELYTYDVNATASPAPSYRLTSSPAGMTINSLTGQIQWTPLSTGSYTVSLEVYNGSSPVATQSYTISVSGATSSSPVINSIPDKSALIDQLYTYDVNASGNPIPTYKLTDSPSNMIINSSTGVIQWIPTSSGSFNVTVEASNGINPVAVQSFVISVSENTAIIPAGAVSYWKLDEKSGTAFKDEIGNNNASAISLPVAVTGLVGGAQKFNGSTSKLDVQANSSFDFGAKENFSVEFWYNGMGAPSTVKCAIGRFFPNGERWWVGLNANDGRARFYMSGGSASAAITGKIITDGKWHHVAATRNGSSGKINLYVDGVLQSSIIKSFTNDFASSSANLNIGWLNYQSVYTLSGNLDEIAFHKIELTASDIQDHYKKGIAGSSYFNTSVTSSYVTVNTKIFLQGPYINGLMSTQLESSSLLPLNQPYNSAPWNYTGSEKVTSLPSDVVDWVLIELRNGTAFSTVLKKRAGFLKKDGSIVDLDGVSKLKFDNIAPASYYIVIKHRNHLDIMSSSPVAISSSSSLYDFTSASSKAYGSGSLINLENGAYGMISGDGDANGIINVLDYGTVSQDINRTGYLQGDYDLNNIVDASDYNKSGSGLFQSTKVPQ